MENLRGGAEPEWVTLHSELVALCQRRGELERLEGKCLLRAERAGVHHHFGCASFAEYVERLFGYSYRTLEEKLRVARALELLPETGRALEAGTLSWSAARELTRVATRETEGIWLQAAMGRTVRQVERMVSGHAPGDRPGDRAQPELERYVLRFEVRAETYATLREALRRLRRDTDGSLDDDAALLLLARGALSSDRDPGRASYQVVLHRCERCKRGSQAANGADVPIDAAMVNMARCDAFEVQPPKIKSEDRGSGHPAFETGENENENEVGRAPTRKTELAPAPKSRFGRTSAESPHVGARGRQSIPPAIRRAVMLRDHGRCVVPGCRHATFVDVHHLRARACGGAHARDNLIVLCAAHHRAVHDGRLVLEGHVRAGLRFRHANGNAYGDLGGLSLAPESGEAIRIGEAREGNVGLRSENQRAGANWGERADGGIDGGVRGSAHENGNSDRRAAGGVMASAEAPESGKAEANSALGARERCRSALRNLGYSERAARAAVDAATRAGAHVGTQGLLRAALRCAASAE